MDLVSLKELQESCLKKNIPFVSYRMPESIVPVTYLTTSKLNFAKDQILSEGKNLKGFAFSPFNKKLPSVWLNADIILNGYQFENPEIEPLTGIIKNIKSKPLPQVSTKEDYLNQVEKILDAIRSKEVSKVVLSRIVTIKFEKETEAALLFNNLSTNFVKAFVYLINIPGIGCWLGATPELLLSAKNQTPCSADSGSLLSIETMALAGTRLLGSEGKWNQKEIEEQEWVSTYIESALTSSGCQEIQKSGTYTCPAANVEHLRTDFRGTIDISNLELLLNNLHPTPAVCGWPLEKALKIIAETENYDRSYYCGYLGPVDSKHNLSLFVNLRCMEVHSQAASLYVGGGITTGSVPEAEWNETSIKSRTLLSEIEKIQNLAL